MAFLNLAFVVLLFASVFSAWINQKTIYNSSTNAPYAALFTDLSTGITHVAFTESSANDTSVTLKYMQVTKTNAILMEAKPIASLKSLFVISIVGAGDGKRVFISYDDARVDSELECTEAEKGGCLDVYFLETADNGKTFTVPIQVPRKSMTDAVHRFSSSFTYMKDSDRIVITFLRGTDATIRELCLCTRPKGSAVFSSEKPFLKSAIDAFDIAYTKVGNRNILHVLIQTQESTEKFTMNYIYSDNLGSSWSKPATIYSYTPGEGDFVLKSQTSAGTVLVVLNVKEGEDYNLKYVFTLDNGKTWKYKTVSSESDSARVVEDISMTETNKEKAAFYMAFGVQEFSKVNLETLKVDHMDYIHLQTLENAVYENGKETVKGIGTWGESIEIASFIED